MIRNAAIIASVVLLSACASHRGRGETPQPPPAARAPLAITVVENITYTPASWPQALQADLYEPAGEGPFPAVLMIHGGGWERRSRDDMVAISRAVAQRGYVVMNVSYRFAPQWHFPAQLQDMQQAILWLRAHAAAHRVRADRIAVWGYSAGAHLAALVGFVGAGDRHFVEGTRVQAVVAGGTPVDVRYWKSGRLTKGLMGVSYDQDPELWREASPIAFVTPDDPPTFLYHGTFDFTVNVRNAHAMYEALNAADVPAELYLMRGLEHFSTFFADAPVEEGIDFLDRYLR